MFAFPEIRVGNPLKYGNLTLYPLFGKHAENLDYLLSETALANGTAVVEEVSESGSVPQLSVTVTAEKPVLFLEGEELRGAKQNRVLNTSILVAAHSKSLLPVSCVEQGRWRYASRQFGSAGTHASAKLRRVIKASVSDTIREGRGHQSNQSEVWQEVSRQMNSLSADSVTMAMSDTYSTHQESLENYQKNLVYPAGAIGMAAAIGGRVISLDVFDSPETCQRVWPRVLTGLTMDAIEAQPTAMEPDVSGAMSTFQSAPWKAVTAAGVGEEYRTMGVNQQTHGSVLAKDGSLIHGSMMFMDPPTVGA